MSAPSVQDLLAPFDPTAFNTITGAQLGQLTNGATPYGDKGLMMMSVDVAGVPQVPNANVVTKWQNYLWIRVSATFVTVYVWNPNGATDVTFLNWVTLSSASIGPGTIQGYQIANSTISASNIISIGSTQITGSIVNAWLAQLNGGQTAYVTNGIIQANSPLFGDLGGTGSTLATPVIANGVIGTAKLALQSVTGSETLGAAVIKDNTVSKVQILNNGQSGCTAFTDAGVDPFNNIVVPTTSVIGIPSGGSSTQNSAAGDVLSVNANKNGFATVSRAVLNLADPSGVATERVLRVASGATVYSLANPQGNSSYGRLLQTQETFDTTATSNAGTLADTSTPTQSNTTLPTGLTVSITPLSSTSKIQVELCMYLSTGSAASILIAALFQGATANAVAAATGIPGVANHAVPIIMRFTIANQTAGTPITFASGYVGSTGTTGYNSNTPGTKPFSGTPGIASYIRATEYL